MVVNFATVDLRRPPANYYAPTGLSPLSRVSVKCRNCNQHYGVSLQYLPYVATCVVNWGPFQVPHFQICSALCWMSETAVNTFSVPKWLTTTWRKMSHTQQQVLKWFKNAWKSEKNVTCHHSITLQLLPKLCICNITMVVAFFHSWSTSYLDCLNYDQGILRICMIVGCCVQRILAALGRSVGKCTNAQLLSSLSSKSNPNSCNSLQPYIDVCFARASQCSYNVLLPGVLLILCLLAHFFRFDLILHCTATTDFLLLFSLCFLYMCRLFFLGSI